MCHCFPHPISDIFLLLIWTFDVRIYVLALHLFEDISTFLKDFGYLLNLFKVTCYFGTTSIFDKKMPNFFSFFLPIFTKRFGKSSQWFKMNTNFQFENGGDNH